MAINVFFTVMLITIAMPLHAMCPTATYSPAPVTDGVSKQLAVERRAQVQDVRYVLSFNIPEEKAKPVTGEGTISFEWQGKKSDSLQIDFQGEVSGHIRVNGKARPAYHRREHIIIPGRLLKCGKVNHVKVAFVSGDKALNRNDDYLYTLFVPDHARSVFPCFDQPDIKARFQLALQLPSEWTAISNGKSLPNTPQGGGRTSFGFEETDLLPTYLFSFTAGKFHTATAWRDGRELTILHREDDSKKTSQLDTIFDQAALSLRWLEEYTHIKQPFQKYGLVVLPGYQFGGMEHPGCIQLRDQTVFLDDNPTIDERLNRLQLIAHETSHLWFGDLVTMRWFNDVWTKEVFANFMADKIAREQYPDINHDINFLKTHYLLALSTDRTEGTHPIQQPLDNLNNAGLLYGNIIYHKAPIMMRQLEERMGAEAFQRGLQKYLKKFSFANATWDDLIDILDHERPDAALKDFDALWVKKKGLAEVMVHAENGDFDPMAYGRYVMGGNSRQWLLSQWFTLPETQRYAAMIYIHDSYLRHQTSNAEAFTSLINGVRQQDNQLVTATCFSLLHDILTDTPSSLRPDYEKEMMTFGMQCADKSLRRRLLQGLTTRAISPAIVDTIYKIWETADHEVFNDRDYMGMAYHLALMIPDRCEQILSTQRQRLKNADLIKEFDFVSRGCTPDTNEQQRLFESLLLKENRAIEPYASALLSLLNDPLREPFSNRYILPALEKLEEVQQTGDIFFPLNWCQALLSGHRSKEARNLVRQFLQTHPNYPENLKGKLLQAAYRTMNNEK
ncbi:MAG: aminopeptidase [Prevotella sp.]|nr:aminopeptidase [Prevotella sp.]